MKYFALTNLGLEQTAKQEIKELFETDSVMNKNVLEFETEKAVELQSVRRILTAITKTKNIEEINLPKNFSYQDFFTTEKTFKVEVEGIKGQENRIKIAKEVAGKLFEMLKPVSPELELKNPDFFVIVYFNGEEYFIGIDKNVGELNSRKYRVFPHSASFKGDLGYHLVRISGFQKDKKLLVGFCKDGVIAIEAALFSKQTVFAFDEVMPNVTATRKNGKIAKVDLKVQKYDLDDLDVKFEENEFDNLIFHVTTKDEDKINEIYYQANYVLKSKGTLLLFGREHWELSISDKFKLIEEGEIHRGDSVLKHWLLKKK